MGLAGRASRAYEAEFAGRLLIAPDDVARWHAEPADGLCWGTLGVAGFDFLVRGPAELDHLPVLFERGVRVFQLAATAANLLAGTAETGDDRGLTDLGRAFLVRLNEVSDYHAPGSMPIVDLAGLNSRSITGILDWYESQSSHRDRLLLMFSHGEVSLPLDATARALKRDQVVRLRVVGGVVGLTPSRSSDQTTEEFKALIDAIASIPFEGRSGHKGIAVGTNFLACEQTLAGVADVTQITTWVGRTFDRDAATLLLAGNASQLLARAAGLPPGAGPP